MREDNNHSSKSNVTAVFSPLWSISSLNNINNHRKHTFVGILSQALSTFSLSMKWEAHAVFHKVSRVQRQYKQHVSNWCSCRRQSETVANTVMTSCMFEKYRFCEHCYWLKTLKLLPDVACNKSFRIRTVILITLSFHFQ